MIWVALRDIDDERDTLLFGDLRHRRGLAGIEGADQKLGAVVDQLFGVLAGGVDVRLGVAVDDRQLRHAERLENAGRDVDAALAVLADSGLEAGARQYHADFQRAALGAQDGGRGDSGGGGGGAGQEVAAVGQYVCAIHGNILPGFDEMLGNCCGGGKRDHAREKLRRCRSDA